MRTRKSFKDRVNERRDFDTDLAPKIEIVKISKKLENDFVTNQIDIEIENEHHNYDVKVTDFMVENLELTGNIKGLRRYGGKPDIKQLENEIINIHQLFSEC